MKLKRTIALLLVLVLTLSLVVSCERPSDKNKDNGQSNEASSTDSASPAADGVIEVKIGHTDSSSRSTHKAAVWLGEYLEEKAPGKFKVTVYPDGQLGDSPDLFAGVKLGTLQVAFDLSSVVTTAAGPASSCIDLPYLYPTYEDWIKGTFELGGLDVFNETLADAGYYCLDMFYNGMRQVISKDKNYHNSEDLKGQKIRIAQNELNIELWKAMGANPTPMAWSEVITSLSQGQVNALDHSLGVFNDFSLHEIAKHITLTNHASSPFPLVCSKEWIDKMPEAEKKIFMEGVHLMAQKQRDEERANEQKYIERFKNEGATVEELTPEEVEAFKKAVQPVYDNLRKQVGDEVMDKWLATVPK
ncbi:TRAP transporter substrate-binding protein [Guggenheimella bovis]